MKDYEKQTQEIYNQMSCIWPQDNSWYDYTHSQILKFIYKNKSIFNSEDKVLNAGSGGTVYDIRGNMYHVDLATNLINIFQTHISLQLKRCRFLTAF